MGVQVKEARRVLEATAARQGGYFTAGQALAAGYSYQGQKYHADRGNWLRADRGIYRLPGALGETEDDYARWDLWSGGRGVLSHGTALAIHDFGTTDPAVVTMTVPPGFRATHRAVRLFKRLLPAEDVERRSGFAVTAPVRTLLDTAGEYGTQEQLDQAVADAVSRGFADGRELLWRADEFGDRAALRLERAFAALRAAP
ncbi:MAG: type IV toxin-antitoxin system AbiEi family antitoxin domain-containing protein [Bifidobacteriaceae bacterium]|nr:type IV toxin-antitoxin system AbiEi family antitoxin domain-containing protein [Bifidobacteriaceae bacterium]